MTIIKYKLNSISDERNGVNENQIEKKTKNIKKERDKITGA